MIQDESRICTEEEIRAVVASIDYSNISKAKHLLKSLGNFARQGMASFTLFPYLLFHDNNTMNQEENRTVLEKGGAATAAKESLEKGKSDSELLSFSARLIGNMTYDHGMEVNLL